MCEDETLQLKNKTLWELVTLTPKKGDTSR